VGHGSPSRSLPSLYLYLCLWGHRGKPKKRGREENVGEMGENGERAGEECGISTGVGVTPCCGCSKNKKTLQKTQQKQQKMGKKKAHTHTHA